MEPARMWELSAQELRRIARYALWIADAKDAQPDFSDALPVEVHDAIGDLLQKDDVTALGRLACTNRFFRDLHRRRLEEMKREHAELCEKYAAAFETFKPVINFGSLRPLKHLLKSRFDNQGYRSYGHFMRNGLDTWEKVETMLSMKSPRRCLLVLDVPCRGGKTRQNVGTTLLDTLETWHYETDAYTAELEFV